MASTYLGKDLEASVGKGDAFVTSRPDGDSGSEDVVAGEIVHARRAQSNFYVLRKMREGEEWLDRKVGIELQGIDRVPDDQKNPPSLWNVFLLWWSLNVHVGVIALGLVGPTFGLGLQASVAATVTGNILGALCTGFTGTLSPKLGLRQIAVSRYSFGFWGAKLCSVLNVIIGGGFYVVNLVVVGQMLNAVSGYTLSVTVGIVIIAVLSYVISIFGFRIIHTYEKYSWIVAFILLCVLLGQAAPHVDPSIPSDAGTGSVYAGTFLTVVAIMFSNASGWCSIAGDYYVQYPAATPRWKIFALSWAGVTIPVTFSTIVGSCIANAAITAQYGPYADAYNEHGFGGLLLTIYHPLGWSKFCLIILSFSVLGNNIAINYSSGLSIQLLGHYFHAVPRLIWSLLFAIVVAVLAIAGQSSLYNVINEFVSLLGYWTISFTFILLVEDLWFRRHDGYALSTWDTPSKLPWGLAAVFALLAGYLGGGLTGMAQILYTGPIAMKFGGEGGDVGIFLSGAITLVVYPIARTIEKKYTGR